LARFELIKIDKIQRVFPPGGYNSQDVFFKLLTFKIDTFRESAHAFLLSAGREAWKLFDIFRSTIRVSFWYCYLLDAAIFQGTISFGHF